jgi:hypothetical protein
MGDTHSMTELPGQQKGKSMAEHLINPADHQTMVCLHVQVPAVWDTEETHELREGFFFFFF